MKTQKKHCDVEGAEAFIAWQDKVLIAKRSDQEDFLAGYWELIGGRVEKGESREEACAREVAEEAGLQINVISAYYEYGYTVPDGRYVCGTAYFCQPQEQPKITLSEEHQEYAWISTAELKDIRPMTDEMRDRIKKGFLELTDVILTT